MNKSEFISQLKSGLAGYDAKEIEEITADYEEHFQSAGESGKSEEEICSALGSPSAIAKAYKVENLLKKAKSDKNPSDYLRAFLVFISLGMFNLLFVLNPVLGLIAALFAIWLLVPLSVGLGAVGMIAPFIAPFVDEQVMEIEMNFINYLVVFLLGVGTLALGILLSILLWRLTKWFLGLLLKYIEANIKLLKTRT